MEYGPIAEINETEEQWTDFGMVLVKLWLHISPQEQLKRFKEREQIPDKQWKITDEDWRNREKWAAFTKKRSTTCSSKPVRSARRGPLSKRRRNCTPASKCLKP
jgi:polyphosphate kinase 2 (PPK2 family)